MVIPFTLLFGTLAIIFYSSKKEVTLIDDLSNEIKEEDDDIYKNLEDLFI